MELLPILNKEKTLIYLDPPYKNVSNLYFKDNETNFEDDLLNLCNHLNQNGFKFLLSNSYNDYILDKFKDFSIDTIKWFDS